MKYMGKLNSCVFRGGGVQREVTHPLLQFSLLAPGECLCYCPRKTSSRIVQRKSGDTRVHFQEHEFFNGRLLGCFNGNTASSTVSKEKQKPAPQRCLDPSKRTQYYMNSGL